MIISRRRGYVFVHIPKTGGTSVALRLEARAAADDILIGDTPKAVRRRHRLKGLGAAGRLWKHSRLGDIDGLVGADELDRLFVFTLVRNPWDRWVSYYTWLRKQSFDHPSVALSRCEGFPGFLRHPDITAAIQDDAAERYVTTAAGTLRCDAFVRLEALEADLPAVEAAIGVPILPLPRANASGRAADYREHYDEDLAALVADLCAPDIARFGYRF